MMKFHKEILGFVFTTLLFDVWCDGLDTADLIKLEEQPTINKKKVSSRERRTLGGNELSIPFVPFLIYMVAKEKPGIPSTYKYCSGIIINEDWILTAAHCTNTQIQTIHAGTSTTLISKKGSTRHYARYVLKHPDSRLDLALIDVDPPFKWDSRHKPIKFYPVGKDPSAKTKGYAVGFGADPNLLILLQSRIRSVKLPIIKADECKLIYEKAGKVDIIKDLQNFFCAGYFGSEKQKGTCPGDDGGPFIVQERLAGIITSSPPCDGRERLPTIIADISKLRAWIEGELDRWTRRYNSSIVAVPPFDTTANISERLAHTLSYDSVEDQPDVTLVQQ